ncbi:XRE family transcriptional regulator [Actinoallomurus sp. NBC_01490]|jgi:transcriptional regulator with XRE-family HTH domain|uniref:helix-turn-helix domain-containing protein n=1 Tax=Actinoallomurus sp. NBC_01490 TaxID=2903557 RepID=UPI002E349559|nr:XRE family transcriptional regulator [Actinoallomurus sp. NBC_01490]
MGRMVGAQVRRLRLLRKMSVSALARESGVSKATLSNIEAGQGNPTIETIAAIAVALRLPLGDLIQPVPPPGPVALRATEVTGPFKQELFHRIGPGMNTEVWRLRIAVAGYRIESPGHIAGTIEHIVVDRGPITISVDGESLDLDSGDFVIFPADSPHFYEARGQDVRAVVVMSYPVMP